MKRVALVAALAVAGLLTEAQARPEQDEQQIRAWMVDLEAEDWRVRQNAAERLGAAGAMAAKPALVALLADPARFDAHPAALRALGRIGELTASESAALVGALADSDPVIAGSAARAIGDCPSSALDAVIPLADLIEHRPPDPAAPPAAAVGWEMIVGGSYWNGYRDRIGNGVTRTVTFAQRGDVRFAWALEVAHQVERPPPPPREPGPAVPGGGAAPPAGPAPADRPFWGLDWRVSCHRIDVVESDEALRVRAIDQKAQMEWTVGDGGKSLRGPPRTWRQEWSHFHRSGGPNLAIQARTLAYQTLGVLVHREVPVADLGALLSREGGRLPSLGARGLRDREGADAFAMPLLRFAVCGSRWTQEDARASFLALTANADECLRDALLSDDDALRYGVMTNIRHFGAHAGLAAVVLGDWVAEGKTQQGNAYSALRDLGPDALPALPGLIRVIEENKQPSGNAFEVIRRIGPTATDAMPVLLHVARTRPGYGHARQDATRAIASVSPDHPELPGFVVACVSDPNDNVASHTLLWLAGWQRPVPDGVVDAILLLCRRGSWEMRRDAATALGLHGGQRADVRETLVALMDDEQPYVRIEAAISLDVVSPAHYRTVRVLVALLDHENWSIRWHAALALREVGPEAKRAVPRLRRSSAEDEHGHVRDAAEKAIKAIVGT